MADDLWIEWLRSLLEDQKVNWTCDSLLKRNPWDKGFPFPSSTQCLLAPYWHTCTCHPHTYTHTHTHTCMSLSHTHTHTFIYLSICVRVYICYFCIHCMSQPVLHSTVPSTNLFYKISVNKYYPKSSLKCRSLRHNPGYPKSVEPWWDPEIVLLRWLMQCQEAGFSQFGTVLPLTPQKESILFQSTGVGHMTLESIRCGYTLIHVP